MTVARSSLSARGLKLVCSDRRDRAVGVARSSLSARGLKHLLAPCVNRGKRVARSSLSARGLKHHDVVVCSPIAGRALKLERAWIETDAPRQEQPIHAVARSSLSARGLKLDVAHDRFRDVYVARSSLSARGLKHALHMRFAAAVGSRAQA